MKVSSLCLGFAVAVTAIGLFAAPAVAHADTYEFFHLTSGSPHIGIVGITASGTVVLVLHAAGAPSCNNTQPCYATWVNGVMINPFSGIKPSFVYDNGMPCTVDAPFLAFSVPGTCNNGHEVYNAGPAAMAPYTDATFTGPDPVTDLFAIAPLSVDEVHLNSSGDFVYDISHPAGGYGEIYEAVDLTTDAPEPSSIFLLGTGLFAFAGSLRRRLF